MSGGPDLGRPGVRRHRRPRRCLVRRRRVGRHRGRRGRAGRRRRRPDLVPRRVGRRGRHGGPAGHHAGVHPGRHGHPGGPLPPATGRSPPTSPGPRRRCSPVATLDLRRRTVRPGHGWVALVGGGPGSDGLLTSRARELLASADVVVVDRLAPRGVVDRLPSTVRVVDVGKAPGRHALAQDAINDLLVEEALAGHAVVRLKGGDPYVLGRGGEERLACEAHGIRVEVVPGVTSAVAVPAAAGIPVTHRGVARGFTVVTGHDELPAVPPGTDHTVVLLMGVGRLARSATVAAGCRPPGIVPRRDRRARVRPRPAGHLRHPRRHRRRGHRGRGREPGRRRRGRRRAAQPRLPRLTVSANVGEDRRPGRRSSPTFAVGPASSADERAQHVLQDAAVAVVVGLTGGVDAHDGLEARLASRPRR